MWEALTQPVTLPWLVYAALALLLVAVGAVVGWTLRRDRRVPRKVRDSEPRLGGSVYASAAVSPVRVDPEPTVPIAGSELPPRAGVALPDTAVMPAFTDEPLLPDTLPRREDLGPVAVSEREHPAVAQATVAAVDVAQRDAAAALEAVRAPEPAAAPVADEPPGRDDDPSAGGGGGALVATAAQRRVDLSAVKPWPSWRGVLPPMARARRAVTGHLRPAITVYRLVWPTRDWVTAARYDLDQATAEAVALWERRPWIRAAARTRTRGRHRTGTTDRAAAKRQVSA